MAPVLAGAAYFALFGGDYNLLELHGLERQRRAEEARLQELRHETDRLRARADSLESDPASLERVARERYGLIRDGERLYRFADTVAMPMRAAPDSAGTTDPRPLRGEG